MIGGEPDEDDDEIETHEGVRPDRFSWQPGEMSVEPPPAEKPADDKASMPAAGNGQ